MALKERVKGNPPNRDLRDVSAQPACMEGEGFPGGSAAKNPPADAGDTRDVGSILGLGRPLRVGNGNPLQYSCLGNPWTQEPGGLQFMGCKEWDTTEHALTHIWKEK